MSAWALGFDADNLDLNPAQTEARRHLGALARVLKGVSDGEQRIGDVTPYEPARVNVYLSAPNDDAVEDGGDAPWPLSRPLHRQRLYQDFDSLCFQVSDDDAAERAQPVRALTDGEQDETAYDWAHPWPVDRRTTTMSLEVWMAHEALVAQVLSRREGWSANDWTRWSWSDVRYVGVDVDGRRYPDVFAECTPYVTDEEPACTIRARFDVATQRLVEFEAS